MSRRVQRLSRLGGKTLRGEWRWLFGCGATLACLLGVIAGAMLIPGKPSSQTVSPASSGPTPEREGGEQFSNNGGPASIAFDATRAINTLIKAGWEQSEARAVVDLNAPYLSIVAQSSAEEVDASIHHLARLGDPGHGYARKRLETFPEMAGVLANAVDGRADGPVRVVTAIGNDLYTQSFVSLFAFSATGEEAVGLADVIARDRDLAVRLVDLDKASLLSWLMPKDLGDPRASEAYEGWARRIIADAVASPRPDALDEAFAILAHGERVAQILREDTGFREALADTVYPAFRRVLEVQPDDGFSREAYLLCPQIWEFIHRHPRDAENLLTKVGPLAIDTVMDPRFAGCQAGLIDVLAFADQRVVDGLLDDRVRGQPRFPAFLQRPLPSETRVAALQLLAREPESAGRRLTQWEAMTTSGVIADVGPPAHGPVTWLPGYAAAVLVTKVAQGRDVTGGDVVFAVVDGVELVFLMRGGGATLKAIGASVRESAARRVGTNVAGKAVQEVSEAVAKRGGRALAPWTLKAARNAAGTIVAELRRVAMVDVTPVVRGLYNRSGLNARTMRIIDRLDPRIFMRRDRRVVIDLAGDSPLGRYLSETATNAGVEKTIGNDAVIAAGRRAVVDAAETVEAARRNIAAWWLAAGDGTLERLAAAVPIAP